MNLVSIDLIALLIFLGVIILAFVRKINVGILAIAAGVIAVRLFGMTDKDLIGGISASMFVTLVGITLLFATINATGALDLLARKIIAMAGSRVWIIPIVIYIAGFIIAGVGPGAVPALAIVPALGVTIALEVGYNPIMLGLIGECGLMAGRMTPITPEAAVISSAAAEVGMGNVMPAILICQTLITAVFSIVLYFIFKGYKVKGQENPLNLRDLEKFNSKQVVSLLGIVAMLILIIFCKVNIGLSAFLVAAVLLLFHIAEDGACLKSLPWGTIVMVLSVGALMNIVDAAGGIDLMSNALSKIMNPLTATPLMGISAGLLSMVSSALGVVYPTMMPMSVDIAAEVGGNVNPVALMAAVGAGGSLSGISPLSTGGALILAAMGTAKKDFTGPEERKTFLQLFVMAGVALLVIVVVSALTFNLIANIVY